MEYFYLTRRVRVSITIRLFRVISKTLVERSYLCRDAVDVFCSPNRLGWFKMWMSSTINLCVCGITWGHLKQKSMFICKDTSQSLNFSEALFIRARENSLQLQPDFSRNFLDVTKLALQCLGKRGKFFLIYLL